MLQPPPPGVYPGLEALIEAANSHARSQGYAIIKRRSKKNKKGELKKVYLECDQGGRYHDQASRLGRTRDCSSRLIECLFSAMASCKEGQWYLDIRHSTHNHEGSLIPTTHPVHHQLSESVQQSIASLSTAGARPKTIVSSIWLDDPYVAIWMWDIYNACAQIHQQNLGPYSPIQALTRQLNNTDLHYMVQYQLQPDSPHIHRLFFAHQESISLLEDFPYVLLADCTYKMNQFKMPLFNIIGMTLVNSTFHFGFAFLAEEKEEDYVWALEQVWDVYSGFTRVRPG